MDPDIYWTLRFLNTDMVPCLSTSISLVFHQWDGTAVL